MSSFGLIEKIRSCLIFIRLYFSSFLQKRDEFGAKNIANSNFATEHIVKWKFWHNFFVRSKKIKKKMSIKDLEHCQLDYAQGHKRLQWKSVCSYNVGESILWMKIEKSYSAQCCNMVKIQTPFYALFCHFNWYTYCSRALKSRSKLRAAIGLRAEFEKLLLHQNSSLCTVTFGEKVLTFAKSRGS